MKKRCEDNDLEIKQKFLVKCPTVFKSVLQALQNSTKEYMVEIEVKSAVVDNDSLARLTAFLQNTVSELERSTDSKYERGLRLHLISGRPPTAAV